MSVFERVGEIRPIGGKVVFRMQLLSMLQPNVVGAGIAPAGNAEFLRRFPMTLRGRREESRWERQSRLRDQSGGRASCRRGLGDCFPRPAKRLLKKPETKNCGCFWDGKSGFAGWAFDRPWRAAALLFAGFVAIQSGSWATFLHRASPSIKMTRSFSFHDFSTVS